ncbi:MAG TPA: polymer-forming cytoskeletal protein [Longimicrobium sp.]|nr:polymer-forming cytoskeletal protein [Longimicrobium sp.]
MRSLTSAALALLLAAAPSLAAQSHTHDGVSVHRGDKLWFRGQHVVEQAQVIEGDVVVASGSLTVRGEVHGDAVVGGGNLVLEPGSTVYGDAVVTGGKLINRGGRVHGQVHEGTRRGGQPHNGTAAVHLPRGFAGRLGGGLEALVQTLALGLVLAGLGVAMVVYGLPHLNRVSDVVRRAPVMAGGVGLTASILAVPAFVLGILALVLTIVGIPFLLVFVPLFWVAVAAAAGIGVVAFAHALGERTAEQRGRYEPRHRNAYAYLLTGLAVLLAPLLVARLVALAGVPVVSGALETVAWAVLWAAGTVGMGAVLVVASQLWRERRYRQMMGLDGAETAGAD